MTQVTQGPDCAWGRQGPCFTSTELSCLWNALEDMVNGKGLGKRKTTPTWHDVKELLARVLDNCEIADGQWLHNEELYALMQSHCSELARIIRYFVLKPPRHMNPLSDTEMSILDLQMIADQFLNHFCMQVNFDTLASAEMELKDELTSISSVNPKLPWIRIMLIKEVHWVALYSEPSEKGENRTFEYFDSYGEMPEEYICNLLTKASPDKSIRRNTLRHQYDEYMCGVYCLFFVFNRLNGVSLKTFCTIPIDLQMIQQFRDQVQQPECKGL